MNHQASTHISRQQSSRDERRGRLTTKDSSDSNVDSNDHVTEEEPSTDERLP